MNVAETIFDNDQYIGMDARAQYLFEVLQDAGIRMGDTDLYNLAICEWLEVDV